MDVARVVVGVSQAGSFVGEGLAEELLPHVEYTRRARNAADPAKRVRSSLITHRNTDLLKRKEPAFKHFENLFNPMRRDGHSTSPEGPICKDHSQGCPKKKRKGLHCNTSVVLLICSLSRRSQMRRLQRHRHSLVFFPELTFDMRPFFFEASLGEFTTANQQQTFFSV